MTAVIRTELPEHALLQKYRQNGSFTDCYVSQLSHKILFADYITAFYTTPLFRAERLILRWLLKKPSTDVQARQLAAGAISDWAAWTVEERNANQLLMCDHQGRTRSWFMTETQASGAGIITRLYFGSAVVPNVNPSSGKAEMGLGFRALMRFHHWYSVALLRSATAALRVSRARMNSNE